MFDSKSQAEIDEDEKKWAKKLKAADVDKWEALLEADGLGVIGKKNSQLLVAKNVDEAKYKLKQLKQEHVGLQHAIQSIVNHDAIGTTETLEREDKRVITQKLTSWVSGLHYLEMKIKIIGKYQDKMTSSSFKMDLENINLEAKTLLQKAQKQKKSFQDPYVDIDEIERINSLLENQ